jgi:Domain of unknown function (DUF5615)
MSCVSLDFLPGLADEDVLAIARQEQRILVVADRDFGELIFHQGLAMPAFSSSGCRVRFSRPRSNTSTPPLSLPAASSRW